VLDKSVVCGEEVCVPGHRLHLERNIIVLQQRLQSATSHGETDGEHLAGADGVDIEGEEDEHRGRGGACAGGLDGGVDARILGLRDKAHPPTVRILKAVMQAMHESGILNLDVAVLAMLCSGVVCGSGNCVWVSCTRTRASQNQNQFPAANFFVQAGFPSDPHPAHQT
jgi:hypothetical protein